MKESAWMEGRWLRIMVKKELQKKIIKLLNIFKKYIDDVN